MVKDLSNDDIQLVYEYLNEHAVKNISGIFNNRPQVGFLNQKFNTGIMEFDFCNVEVSNEVATASVFVKSYVTARMYVWEIIGVIIVVSLIIVFDFKRKLPKDEPEAEINGENLNQDEVVE